MKRPKGVKRSRGEGALLLPRVPLRSSFSSKIDPHEESNRDGDGRTGTPAAWQKRARETETETDRGKRSAVSESRKQLPERGAP